ncbi:hypothetical protein HYH03_018816 [Edaphochlamys debaryana]|uniref:Uncharacterized protein n=1 Tax=Edaphochlamys debaryana TaxID=47281 RepID=A0A836BMX9_9CHLO|nr:hypothetical protein HYH03_018816 [Edaphochlamys debaryana]|eukprot:KAG2482232.1 hypothetical protein HYH03_018816 [Edaphochlamys debaryana]
MALSFLSPSNVLFDLSAAVSYDSTAPPPSVSFILSASATAASGTPFQIKGFKWIKISYIGGSVGLTPITVFPFVNLRNIEFAALGQIVGVDVSVAVIYDQPNALFAMQAMIKNLDLEKVLAELGVNVDLGPFNLIISSAQFSFADKPTAKAPIIQEVFSKVQSALDDLGINVNIDDEIQIHYISIALNLTTTQTSFAFNFSATLFGVDLKVNNFKLDPKSVPWSQLVSKLKGDILKPLTAACTKDSFDRGSQPISECPDGYEKQGALCYPNCPTDWEYGAHGSLNICYQNCPPGYHDDGVDGTGLTCSYVGCDSNQVQDEIGGLCYDKCNDNYQYSTSRCYKNCDSGWSDSSVFTSCRYWVHLLPGS